MYILILYHVTLLYRMYHCGCVDPLVTWLPEGHRSQACLGWQGWWGLVGAGRGWRDSQRRETTF